MRNAWLQRREFLVRTATSTTSLSSSKKAFKDDPAADAPADAPANPRRTTDPARHELSDNDARGTNERYEPNGTGMLPPLLLLHPDDNILVARRDIAAGERVEIDGESFTMPVAIELGHKLARRALAADTRVLKYGAPIGSMKTGGGARRTRAPAQPAQRLHSLDLPRRRQDGRTLMNALANERLSPQRRPQGHPQRGCGRLSRRVRASRLATDRAEVRRRRRAPHRLSRAATRTSIRSR